PARHLDDARVAEELAQVAAQGRRGGRVGGAELDEQNARVAHASAFAGPSGRPGPAAIARGRRGAALSDRASVRRTHPGAPEHGPDPGPRGPGVNAPPPWRTRALPGRPASR